MDSDTKIYTSKEVAKRIKVEPVTVRKYSQMLEDKGYVFKKDEKGWRQYSDDDIRSLEYLCNMKNMGKSLDESVKHVASLYQSNLNISNTDTSLHEENPILEFMKRQEDFNKKLIERMDQRDKNLMAAIRELQETKKELATTAQEHKKKWWQFWK